MVERGRGVSKIFRMENNVHPGHRVYQWLTDVTPPARLLEGIILLGWRLQACTALQQGNLAISRVFSPKNLCSVATNPGRGIACGEAKDWTYSQANAPGLHRLRRRIRSRSHAIILLYGFSSSGGERPASDIAFSAPAKVLNRARESS